MRRRCETRADVSIQWTNLGEKKEDLELAEVEKRVAIRVDHHWNQDVLERLLNQ
jgi:hypothetical protein